MVGGSIFLDSAALCARALPAKKWFWKFSEQGRERVFSSMLGCSGLRSACPGGLGEREVPIHSHELHRACLTSSYSFARERCIAMTTIQDARTRIIRNHTRAPGTGSGGSECAMRRRAPPPPPMLMRGVSAHAPDAAAGVLQTGSLSLRRPVLRTRAGFFRKWAGQNMTLCARVANT